MSYVFDQVVQDELVGFLEWVQSEVIKDEKIVSGDVVEFFEVSTIGFVIEELGEELGGVRAYHLCPADKIFGAPFADKTVCRRHMIFLGGIPMLFVAVSMQGDPLVLVKNLNVLGVI